MYERLLAKQLFSYSADNTFIAGLVNSGLISIAGVLKVWVGFALPEKIDCSMQIVESKIAILHYL